jgi:hypothetical protein
MTKDQLIFELQSIPGDFEVGLMETDWFQSQFKLRLISINKKGERTKTNSPESKQVLVLR